MAGVFVGPFILVAAASGALYALTPQLEQLVYDDELHAPVAASSLPLADQIRAADAYVAADTSQIETGAAATIVAVRPDPNPGDTTRVMYTDASLGESKTRAVFVDPATAEIRGDLPVYGTSGSLPLRTWISDLHRSLHLGDAGRRSESRRNATSCGRTSRRRGTCAPAACTHPPVSGCWPGRSSCP